MPPTEAAHVPVGGSEDEPVRIPSTEDQQSGTAPAGSKTTRTFRPTHFEVATDDVRLNGAIVEADPKTGRATGIKRISVNSKDADRLANVARCRG